MKKRALPVVLLFLLVLPMPLLAADPVADKAAGIRQMMTLAGVDDLSTFYGKTMTEQIYQVLKTSRPELPPEAMVVIRDEVNKQLTTDRDKLLGQIATIFDQTFSAAEVVELNKFYQTELGKKSVAIIPKIMHENMEIGKKWGKEVGPALKSRLEARFKKDKDGKPAKP